MIKVQRQDFDVGTELSAMVHDNHSIGGQGCFVGLVRDMAGDEKISEMELEHYPGMTEKQLKKIEKEARRRWPLQGVLIIHRYGLLKPGDRIVLVATTSEHREAALESCHFLIDWLKTKALFWKLESGESGKIWVKARDEDDDAANRWESSLS